MNRWIFTNETEILNLVELSLMAYYNITLHFLLIILFKQVQI